MTGKRVRDLSPEEFAEMSALFAPDFLREARAKALEEAAEHVEKNAHGVADAERASNYRNVAGWLRDRAARERRGER